MTREERTALFVRLTAAQAERLDQAANAVHAHKKDLIGGLVDTYVDPSSEAGLNRLRKLAKTPVVIDLGADTPVVGHAEFRPSPLEVLDAAQAAELLAVDEAAIVQLAEAGELPGRKIGTAWRFSRAALLEWLSLK